MIIEVSDKLKERTIEFCDDELNYHIGESYCANEYHTEILAEIEILFLLGEKEKALEYAKLYQEYSKKEFYVTERLSKEERKEIRNLIRMMEKG